MPLPLSIEEVNIETANTCTRRCPYCKFGIERRWDKKVMERRIFEKILYDLKAVNYSGLIGPFANNEPLMDRRMVSFIRMIRDILPSAQSYLFTNGDLLEKDILQKLFDAGLRRIFISVHSGERFEHFLQMVEIFGQGRITLTSTFEMDKKRAFHNRGGSIRSEIVDQTDFSDQGCCLPFRQAVINPDGDLYLCCCDFYYDVVFDNVKDRSLVDIFLNNRQLNAIREQLSLNSRKGLTLCEGCSVPAYAPLLAL